MEQVGLRTFEPIHWDDALVLVAFPTAGSVASIAGHYLQQKLDLPLVGCLLPDRPAPVAAVRHGLATGPIRIFGGETACELPRGQCPRLYLILCDLPLTAESVGPVSQAILREAAGAKLVICLDGVVRQRDDDTPDVWAVAPDKDLLPDLDLKGVGPIADAFVGGLTGQILLDAQGAKARVGALLVEAAADMPDGRAAAALIGAVDQLLPLTPVDPEPLIKEALALEKEISKAREAAEQQTPPPNMRSFV